MAKLTGVKFDRRASKTTKNYCVHWTSVFDLCRIQSFIKIEAFAVLRPKLWPKRWQVSRTAENYCYQWIQHLQIVQYAKFRGKWLTSFPVPLFKDSRQGYFPIPCSPFPVSLFKDSLFKEINRLIRKGIYVLLFDTFNWCSSFSSIKEVNRFVKHLLLRKTDVLKTSILSEKKFEEKHFLGRAKRYIRGNVYFGIIFSWLASIKLCLRFLLICFDWEIKGLYQTFLGNEVDFADIMNVSPNILTKN